MNYVKSVRKVFKSLTIVYRGFHGEKQTDGSIKVGDMFYPDIEGFIKGINEVCDKRFDALTNSIEQTEKLLK